MRELSVFTKDGKRRDHAANARLYVPVFADRTRPIAAGFVTALNSPDGRIDVHRTRDHQESASAPR
jgi:hypothetical protein